MLSLVAAVVMAQKDFKPILPVPTPRQLAWSKLERYCFVHFGPNTFTGNEWGTGKEPTQVFNPKHLDCRQWCRAFKDAGFAGVIITAKHHDGFCLWPSKFSTHTVAQSPWRNGKGDVLKELSQACKEEGLKFGVYLSPWDRNHPSYGTSEYNDTFKSMLKEVLTHYGPVFEVWFDGANGEGPNGKRQVYDWPGFISVVRKYQPKAVIFSDAGPDIRWVGNEGGYAGETNWAMIDKSKFSPGHADTDILNHGLENGPDWVPAECDVSIRPGWFWKATEDPKVKSVQELMDIWYGSVGRGSNLLLNVPANADGLISDVDATRLHEFDQALAKEFAHPVPVVDAEAMSPGGSGLEPAKELIDGEDKTFWHDHKGKTSSQLQFTFAEETTVDRIALSEPIQMGQRIKKFIVHTADRSNGYKTLVAGTTIGVQRVLKFPPTKAKEIWVEIQDSRGTPALSSVQFFNAGL
ncbi:MAG TPA: alpha-L-fucosidase [Fimbriimonadaceae bacterium]|nr:alpha-L-fucosidase [Fimbriimonadaceae bacterium]